MDTNRTFFTACVAALALLLASGASAQTIYKQVDNEGRVTFTDRPSSAARVITTFESRGEPVRKPMQEQAGDYSPRQAEIPSPSAPMETRVTSETLLPKSAVSSAGASRPGSPQVSSITPGMEPLAAETGTSAARSNYGEAERAAATYTSLDTPLAARADATEAARRARQEANKGPAAPILVVQAAPRDHEAAPKSGVGTFYILWVVTFFILAAGLLYVGWQVFRLILGTAFPRWHVGIG